MLNYKEYIYAIYQEHSFSKAAQKLFVSQISGGNFSSEKWLRSKIASFS